MTCKYALVGVKIGETMMLHISNGAFCMHCGGTFEEINTVVVWRGHSIDNEFEEERDVLSVPSGLICPRCGMDVNTIFSPCGSDALREVKLGTAG